MVHVLLDAEVVNSQTEVKRGGHCDWGKIGRAVVASAHMIEGREVSGLFGVRDAAAVHDRHADVVDPLMTNEIVGVPHGVEDFSCGDWSCGVTTDEFEALLKFGGAGVFHPEEVVGFERLAEACGFDRREPMVDVVEKVDVGTELNAEFFEERWDEVEIFFG